MDLDRASNVQAEKEDPDPFTIAALIVAAVAGVASVASWVEQHQAIKQAKAEKRRQDLETLRTALGKLKTLASGLIGVTAEIEELFGRLSLSERVNEIPLRYGSLELDLTPEQHREFRDLKKRIIRLNDLIADAEHEFRVAVTGLAIDISPQAREVAGQIQREVSAATSHDATYGDALDRLATAARLSEELIVLLQRDIDISS